MSSEYPEELRYSEEHEWIDPNTGWMGITDYAQQQLGDIVFVDLPAVETTVQADESILIVESVKSVSDVYSPASGTIKEVNSDLESAPENVNQDPYEDGRLVQLQTDSIPDTLMTAEEYQDFIS